MIVRDESEVVYPDTDGVPIAESSTQFDAISSLKWGLEELFADRPDVAVHGDMFWYPRRGDPTERQAPDVMVAFGRPKRERPSYLQWDEGGIPPQVVFEVLSPSNTFEEMTAKREWYEAHGVEEYYEVDPELRRAEGWVRRGDKLVQLTASAMSGWVSPRLGVRFDQRPGPLVFRRPDGEPLEPVLDRFLRGRQAEHDARRERDRAESAAAERDEALRRAEQAAAERNAATAERDAVTAERDAARVRAERLAERLRALGVDPDAAG